MHESTTQTLRAQVEALIKGLLRLLIGEVPPDGLAKEATGSVTQIADTGRAGALGEKAGCRVRHGSLCC